MDRNCLSVSFVEKLQIADQRGLRVEELINQLRRATLPGLLEYGCLRYARPERFPSLPNAIVRSQLGAALLRVSSELGFRFDGDAYAKKKGLAPSPIEFFVLHSEAEIESVGWDSFCFRFEKAAKNAGFSVATSMRLQTALFEMASNAVIHADSPAIPLIGFAVERDRALFSVVDVGMGVLRSLRSSKKYEHLTEPIEAIELAYRPGVSRFRHGGAGFANVFKALASDWGRVRLRSGNGCVTMDGIGLTFDHDEIRRTYPPDLPGFQVTVCCDMRKSRRP